MLLWCALKYAFDNVSNNVLSLQMRINMQCSQYEYFPRVCCARTRAVRLHQTIQHEVLPFCSEDPTGAEWKRHKVSYSPARCNLKPNVTFVFGPVLYIRHDIVNINLRDKPDWFLEKNPLGQVPTLETSAGEVIYESPITCEYLDEMYPEKKLLPDKPFGKAEHKMLLEKFSKVSELGHGIN